MMQLPPGFRVVEQPQQQPAQPAIPRVIQGPPDPRLGFEEERIRLAREAAARAAAADQRAQEIHDRTVEQPVVAPGQRALDTDYAKRYSDWRLTGSADVRRQLAQLEDAMSRLETNNVTGPIIGRLPDVVNEVFNPQAVPTREAVEEVVQRNLRAILGAQFTEREGERLIARAFNPRLPEAENRIRLQRLLRQVRQMADANESAAQYYEQHGTLQGWTGRLPTSADDFDLDNDGPAASGTTSTPDDETLSVEVVGGRLPQSLEEASPEFISAYAAAKRQNPGLTFQQFISEYGGRGREPVSEAPAEQPGIGRQLLDATTNTVAGIGQGLAAIPDAAANAAGAILAVPAEALGFDNVARDLRNPITIGGAIENIAPTPEDTGGQIARFGSQFLGGAASVPMRAQNALARGIAGDVPRAPPPNALSGTSGRDVGAAAERLQRATGTPVRMLPADVGGPATRMVSGGVSRSLGGIPMARAAEESIGSVQNARNALAGRIGSASDEAGAGRAVRRGVQSFMDDSAPVSRLYNRIPIPDEAPAQLDNARAALANSTNPIRSNRELSELVADPRFRSWQAALAPDGQGGGNLSWWDLKEFRTRVGRLVSSGSDETGDLRNLYGALTRDMEATARAAGPAALRAFTRANNYTRGRQQRIEQVLQRVLGTRTERSGEKIYQELNRMAQARGGDARSLGRTLRSLPPDERGEVAATILSRMGMARPEQPGAVGEVFSPALFSRQWAGMSEQARSMLFSDRGLRNALNDLAIVTNGMNRAQQFVNYSNSATTGNLLALLGVGAAVDMGGSALAGATQYGLGMYLARDVMRNPRFVRWLAQAGRVAQSGSEQATRRHVVRLGVIAEGNPQLQQLQQRLAAAIDSPATSAAAQQNEDVR